MFATFLYVAVSVTILALRSKNSTSPVQKAQEAHSIPQEVETPTETFEPPSCLVHLSCPVTLSCPVGFTVEDEPKETSVALEVVETEPLLTEMTIRELKKIASQKKIKKYGNMSKAQLLTALS